MQLHNDSMRLASFVVLAQAAAVVTATAQEPRQIRIGPPSSELREGITHVTQIHELPDGRVVIIDRADARVYLADMTTGDRRTLGREGLGVGEYAQPMWLVSLGGDSVGIYDDAGVRMPVIRPDATLGGFVPPVGTYDGNRAVAQYADKQGWVYGEVNTITRRSDGRFQRSDSATVIRWQVARTAPSPIAKIDRPTPEGMVTNELGVGVPGTFARPSTRNLWRVAADGRIGIVTFNPYRVIYIDTAGVRHAGPEVQHTRSTITDSMKTAFIDERRLPRSGVAMDGATGTATVVRYPPHPKLFPDEIRWAAQPPPFRAEAFVGFDDAGRLWVQRTTFGDEGGRYDVFGRDGSLIGRVELPPMHRVVGFGRDAVYIARLDGESEVLHRRQIPR